MGANEGLMSAGALFSLILPYPSLGRSDELVMDPRLMMRAPYCWLLSFSFLYFLFLFLSFLYLGLYPCLTFYL